MNRMASTKLNLAVAAGMILTFSTSSWTVLLAQEESRSELSPGEIIQKSRQAYAALSSYSDQGNVVTTKNGKPYVTEAFKIRLGRPNLYQLESRWNNLFRKDPDSEARALTLWSTGEGDTYETLQGNVEHQLQFKPPSTPVPPTAVYTEERSFTISHLFFNSPLNVYEQCCSEGTYIRLPDDRVGDVACFVLERRKDSPMTVTRLWIGSGDFLIRQVRRESTAAQVVNTETHTNLVQNRTYSSQDFAPSSPHESLTPPQSPPPPPPENSLTAQ